MSGKGGSAIRRLDRPWYGVAVFTALEPLSGITVDRVNSRWQEILAALPSTSWLTAYPQPIATVMDSMDREAMANHTAHGPWSGPPVRVYIERDSVIIIHSHAVGDGRCSRLLVRDLLAEPGSPVALASLRSASFWTMAIASLRYWTKSPSRIRTVFSGLRQRTRRTAAYANSSVPGTAPVVMTGRVEAEALNTLKGLLAQQPEPISTSSFLLFRFLCELSERNVSITHVSLPVDLRRYIVNGSRFGGNLVGIQWLPVSVSLSSFSSNLRGSVDCGEPLARFMLAHVRHAVGSPRQDAHSSATLGWSDRGAATDWEQLPWGSQSHHLMTGVSAVWGRRINVSLSRLGGVLHITCSANSAAFDATAVRAAFHASITDFSSLLVEYLEEGEEVAW